MDEYQAAWCSGVQRLKSCSSVTGENSCKSLPTTSIWPFWQAKCRGYSSRLCVRVLNKHTHRPICLSLSGCGNEPFRSALATACSIRGTLVVSLALGRFSLAGYSGRLHRNGIELKERDPSFLSNARIVFVGRTWLTARLSLDAKRLSKRKFETMMSHRSLSSMWSKRFLLPLVSDDGVDA